MWRDFAPILPLQSLDVHFCLVLRTSLIFSGIILLLLVLFQLGRYFHFSTGLEWEVMVTLIAMVCIVVGLMVGKHLFSRHIMKEVYVPVSADFVPDADQIERIGLSNREMDVLEAVGMGLSNQEIAEKLHISEPTVKTHVSNIYSKLNCNRRTQAVNQARTLGLIPK